MPRLSPKRLRKRQNKGNHQRRRSTRGGRFLSKLEKYKWYSFEGGEYDRGNIEKNWCCGEAY